MVNCKLHRITSGGDVDIQTSPIWSLQLSVCVELILKELITVFCNSGIHEDRIDSAELLCALCESCSLLDPVCDVALLEKEP
jgi:hypothetical protein